jgi:hypothetical protein
MYAGEIYTEISYAAFPPAWLTILWPQILW